MIDQVEPDQNATALTYDSLGRVTGITDTSGSLAPAGPVTYTYDANGNRVTMIDVTGTTQYVYDDLNSLTSPGNRVVSYGYDCNDNRTAITFAGKTSPMDTTLSFG